MSNTKQGGSSFKSKVISLSTLVLSALAGLFYLVNYHKESYRYIYKKLGIKQVSYLKMNKVTRTIFDSPENFLMWAEAKIKYNLPLQVALVIIPLGLIALIFWRKKASQNRFRPILDEFEIYDETKSVGKDGAEILDRKYPEIKLKGEGSPEILFYNLTSSQHKKLNEVLTGFLGRMLDEEMISCGEGMLVFQDRPRHYGITLFTPEFLEQQAMEEFLFDKRLFKEVKIGNKIKRLFPEIKFDKEQNLSISCDGFFLENPILRGALQALSDKYITPEIEKEHGLNKFFFVEKTDKVGSKTIYTAYSSKEPEYIIPKGMMFYEKYDEFDEEIARKIRERFDKEGVFYWYLGASRDRGYRVPDEFIVSSTDIPHVMIGGTTGSGKTEFLKLVINTTIMALKDDVELYFANGSSQTIDIDPFVERYSTLGIRESAKLQESEEPLGQLVAILERMINRVKEYRAHFRTLTDITDIAVGDIVSYRKTVKYLITNAEGKYTQEEIDSVPHKLREIILFVDELAGFTQEMDYDSNWNKRGTTAYYMQIILSQYRKFGVRCCFASQDFRDKTIPRRLFGLIAGRAIFKITETEVNYFRSRLEIEFNEIDPSRLEVGQGVLLGVTSCKLTGRKNIPIQSYYIGKDTSLISVLDKNDCDIDKSLKEDYKAKIMLPQGASTNFASLSPSQLQSIIKECFLIREDWEIEKVSPPSFRTFNLYARNEALDLRVGIAFVDPAEMNQGNFPDIVSRDKSKDEDIDTNTDLDLYFVVSEKFDEKKIIDAKLRFMSSLNNSVFLSPTSYKKPLIEAYFRYTDVENDDAREDIFKDFLEATSHDQTSGVIKKNIEEREKSAKRFDNKVHWLSFESIITSSASATAKGDMFEAFYLSLERFYKFDTVSSAEVRADKRLTFDNREVETLFKETRNTRSDLGLDAFRWTDKENMEGIGFQLKNQPSTPLDYKIVDKMKMTHEMYKKAGLKITTMVLVTTGEINDRAKKMILALGYNYVEYRDFLDMYDPDKDVYNSFLFRIGPPPKKMKFLKKEEVEVSNALTKDESLDDVVLTGDDLDDEKGIEDLIDSAIAKIDKENKGGDKSQASIEKSKSIESLLKIANDFKKEKKVRVSKGEQLNILDGKYGEISGDKKTDSDPEIKEGPSDDILDSDLGLDDFTENSLDELPDLDSYLEDSLEGGLESKLESEVEVVSVEVKKTTKGSLKVSKEKRNITDLFENVIGEMNKPYFKIEEWGEYQNISRAKDRKLVRSTYQYVRLHNGKTTLISVNNEKSKNIGSELQLKITAVSNILEERKVKGLSSEIEVYYAGGIAPRSFEGNCLLVDVSDKSEEEIKDLLFSVKK